MGKNEESKLKFRVNVYEEMKLQQGISDREIRKPRLLMYCLQMIIDDVESIEEHIIESPEYKVEGKWKIIDGRCYLEFWDEGVLVRLPFDLDFSTKMIPWLKEVAGLKIDRFIRCRKYGEQDMIPKRERGQM